MSAPCFGISLFLCRFLSQGRTERFLAERFADRNSKTDISVVSVPARCYSFNSGTYWSAGPPLEPKPGWKPTETELAQAEIGAWGSHNNLWETTPKQTAAFMANIMVPWMGFKVLGAGALAPREAFTYTFKNGCDFICVGMYDFQVADNVNTAKSLLQDKDKLGRTRIWA